MSYGGDEDRRSFLLIINWVFVTITLTAVILRLVSRRMLEKNKWEIDDGFLLLAMTVIMAKTIWMTVDISMGYGRPLLELLAEDPVKTAKLARSSYSINAIALWTFTLPKLPVVALLTRIFKVYSVHLGTILYSMLIFLFCWNTAMTVITFVQCDPVEKNWNPPMPGSCWNPRIYLNMGYFSGSYSCTLDFIYALYPMIRISKLQMERSKKILIAASFSLGIPAGIVSLYKLTTIKSLLDDNDPTFATVPLDIWNCVEYTALMLAACVPMTRPMMALIGKRFKSLASLISGRSSNRTGGSSKTDELNNIITIGGTANKHFQKRNGYEVHKSTDDIPLRETQSASESYV